MEKCFPVIVFDIDGETCHGRISREWRVQNYDGDPFILHEGRMEQRNEIRIRLDEAEPGLEIIGLSI